MPLDFSYELTFSNFEKFAQNNAAYAYVQALTATHDVKKAEKLAVNTLYGVLKNKKHFENEENPISEHIAVDLTLRSLLSKKEKNMLDGISDDNNRSDDSIDSADDNFTVYPPSEETERKIISKACDKAESITPKYAPMYTGTKSGVILLVVLIFICGAIYFIWNDPIDILSDKSTSYDSSNTAVSIPNANSLIDIEFVPGEPAQGNIPIQIHISGPDSDLVSSVTYSTDSSSSVSTAYECGDEYWVMMASSNNYYKVNVKGTNGLDVVRYFRVNDAIPTAPEVNVISVDDNGSYYTVNVSVTTSDGASSVSSSDIISVNSSDNGSYIITVPYGNSKTLFFCDNFGNQTTLLITEDGKTVLSPTLTVTELSLGHDSTKNFDLNSFLSNNRSYDVSVTSESENITASIDSENILSITASNGFVGVDSIYLSITDNYGLSTETAIPVIVANSAPFYKDPTELHSTVLHTPSNTGHLFGTLAATDAQDDKITYTLTNQTDCSVTLSPNGSFMLFIDADYRGHSVSFDFTVSDGLLTSEEYRYTISLYNNILKPEKYNHKFVCYTGENGWYSIDLPKTDPDGDLLNWSVTTPLTDDNRTPGGNYIAFADGLSTVLLRVDPQRNENFSETITLTCSDGWLSSDTITLNCKFVENTPPKAGKENHAVIDVNEHSGTFTLDIKDDCEFDKCAIVGVSSISDGEVVENIGWNTLTFTVNFDSPASDLVTDESVNAAKTVTVVLIVKDIVTAETIEVEYTITRKNMD